MILFTVYTLYAFTVFRSGNKNRQNAIFKRQRMIIFTIHSICYFLLFLDTKNIEIIFFYIAQLAFLNITIVIYPWIYKNLSKLILNNMLMLFTIGFIMLTRISYDNAIKQFIFSCVTMILCLVVPIIIEKFKYLDRLGWIYAGGGIAFLLLVFVLGLEKYGATNWIQIGGIALQPSEFVKIIFVFFVAAIFSKRHGFIDVVKVTGVAAIYVLVLVAEKDLGAALIFFSTYLAMLYVATAQPLYLFGGLAGGSLASIIAYKFFTHVQVRVMAWKDPWSDASDGGYQIIQSLFAIGTGGWFGMGLGKGLPSSIPVAESDFIFAAISEEFGGIFAVCIVLIYISCFIMFMNIAMKMKKKFYKLVALGLGVIFVFQVFLSIGGVTKFIPSTGVTLPLLSYGGSSVVSIIILFSIIQGLYVLNQGEDDNIEKERKRNQEQQNPRSPKKKKEKKYES
jgi:cell division protein FtsW (lipid II flippase)